MVLRRSLSVVLAVLAVPLVCGDRVHADVDPAGVVFVNELHYDNAGADVGEAIEVAAPAGTDVAGWTIDLYNGSNGQRYATLALSGVVADQGGGFGTISIAAPGLQNGSPDGLALVAPGGAIEQFLSYEGTFSAVDGSAVGLTSTDIGVAQSGGDPPGSSLALTGTGDAYGDFTWSAAAASFGAVNPGQSFGAGPVGPVASCPSRVTTVAGTATSATVSATDADGTIASIAITSPPVDGITSTDAGDGTAALDVAATTAVGEYPVVIEFATDDGQTTSCTVQVVVEEVTLISEIQGDEPTSPLLGDGVIVRAVVTSLFTRQDVLDGFFVQEEDADADASATTSEGLFVFCRGSCPGTIAAGDLVQLDGSVDEFFGMTQVDTTGGGSIVTLSRGNRRPTAAAVALPAVASTRAAATFESLEGMVVFFDQQLVVSEFFELARFGQLLVTADAVPYQYTHDNRPNAVGYDAYLADLAERRIYLDDDNNDQNDAISGPDDDEPYPYPAGGLAVDNRFRIGDTITNLTGVLHWSFAGGAGTDAWRIRPIPGDEYSFEPENPPPAAPVVGGTLTAATFNVLNYFTTVDTTSSTTVGTCGPSGTLDCRGADSAAELVQQRAKTVAAIDALDADIVGLIEIQNDAGASTADLVAALNAAGDGPYAAIDTGNIGTDAIKVALIYRPAAAAPVGDFRILDSTVDSGFRDQSNRPVLIQTFEQVGTGERLTVAVNHLKSKGSPCPGDPDLRDGQGNCPETRRLAAEALADFLATDPTRSGDPDFLILGDLNAYRREPPITTLVDRGYTDLIEAFVGDDAYSYLFDGQLGYLDHGLASRDLVRQVTGVAEWAVNADEVPLFDYNDTVADPGEAPFERESAARDLHLPDARRSSDHNPLVIGLDLDAVANTLTIDDAVIVGRSGGGGTLAFAGRVGGETFTACPRLVLRIEATVVVDAPTVPVPGPRLRCAVLSRAGVVTFDPATGALAGAVALPRSFTLTDSTVTFDIALDDERFVADVPGRRVGAIWIAS